MLWLSAKGVVAQLVNTDFSRCPHPRIQALQLLGGVAFCVNDPVDTDVTYPDLSSKDGLQRLCGDVAGEDGCTMPSGVSK